MVDMAKIWADLGLSKDANRLSMEQQLLIYNELMRKLQQKCAVELSELFLEQSSLFDRIMSSKEALDDVYDRVHKELKVSCHVDTIIFLFIVHGYCQTNSLSVHVT